jgi:hypothetical protein
VMADSFPWWPVTLLVTRRGGALPGPRATLAGVADVLADCSPAPIGVRGRVPLRPTRSRSTRSPTGRGPRRSSCCRSCS